MWIVWDHNVHRVPAVQGKSHNNKNHGTQKLIEGIYSNNNKVLLIEDVTTTGNSVIEAAQLLEKKGLNLFS